MATGLERAFRPVRLEGYNGPPIYREIHMHYLHFLNEDGTVRKSKLDKMIEGRFVTEALNKTDHSTYGEMEYTFPDGQTKRLLVLGTDVYGRPVLPQV